MGTILNYDLDKNKVIRGIKYFNPVLEIVKAGYVIGGFILSWKAKVKN